MLRAPRMCTYAVAQLASAHCSLSPLAYSCRPPPFPRTSAQGRRAQSDCPYLQGSSTPLKPQPHPARSLWRLLFLSGLFTGGLCLQYIYPAAFDPPTVLEALPLPRLMAAGLAVGAGTALSNGCTSGHGICGNARMSPRCAAAPGFFAGMV